MSQAYNAGYKDGLDWDLSGFETRNEIERCEGWDETLINFTGPTKTAEHLGLASLYDSAGVLADEARAALELYSDGCRAGALEQWDSQ